ncbi:MAG: cupredoxin domain-containing protein [Chloroflexales bacterium]|nr:cupredoxin domain-containing protein [Chloroflexales bacterium]
MSYFLCRLGVFMAVALGFFALLAPTASAAPNTAETKTVSIQNSAFDASSITINVGDTIVWKNNDQIPHTVDTGNGSFMSGNLDAGAEFSFTFEEAGAYAYYCAYHGGPGGVGMAGTVGRAGSARRPAARRPANLSDAGLHAVRLSQGDCKHDIHPWRSDQPDCRREPG